MQPRQEEKPTPLTKKEESELRKKLKELQESFFDLGYEDIEKTIDGINRYGSSERSRLNAFFGALCNPFGKILKHGDCHSFILLVRLIENKLNDPDKKSILLKKITEFAIENTNNVDIVKYLEEKFFHKKIAFHTFISRDTLLKLSYQRYFEGLKYIVSKLSEEQRNDGEFFEVLRQIVSTAMDDALSGQKEERQFVESLSQQYLAIFAYVVGYTGHRGHKPSGEEYISPYTLIRPYIFEQIGLLQKQAQNGPLVLNDEMAKRCFYMIRFLIREHNTRFDLIDFLLFDIPEVRALIPHDQFFPILSFSFEGERGGDNLSDLRRYPTLISLAFGVNNQEAIDSLLKLNIPKVREDYEVLRNKKDREERIESALCEGYWKAVSLYAESGEASLQSAWKASGEAVLQHFHEEKQESSKRKPQSSFNSTPLYCAYGRAHIEAFSRLKNPNCDVMEVFKSAWEKGEQGFEEFFKFQMPMPMPMPMPSNNKRLRPSDCSMFKRESEATHRAPQTVAGKISEALRNQRLLKILAEELRNALLEEKGESQHLTSDAVPAPSSPTPRGPRK